MEGHELVQSFDARVWAEEFCKLNPSIEFDVALTWFSNALMAGYDHHHFKSKEYKRSIRRALVPWWRRPFVPLERFGR